MDPWEETKIGIEFIPTLINEEHPEYILSRLLMIDTRTVSVGVMSWVGRFGRKVKEVIVATVFRKERLFKRRIYIFDINRSGDSLVTVFLRVY